MRAAVHALVGKAWSLNLHICSPLTLIDRSGQPVRLARTGRVAVWVRPPRMAPRWRRDGRLGLGPFRPFLAFWGWPDPPGAGTGRLTTPRPVPAGQSSLSAYTWADCTQIRNFTLTFRPQSSDSAYTWADCTQIRNYGSARATRLGRPATEKGGQTSESTYVRRPCTQKRRFLFS